MSTEFSQYLIFRDTVHQRSCAYTLGIAERKNRYLLETVRAMMFEMNVPNLGRSCVDRTYLINRIPSKFLLEASLITLIYKVFGCSSLSFFKDSRKEANERKRAQRNKRSEQQEKIDSRR